MRGYKILAICDTHGHINGDFMGNVVEDMQNADIIFLLGDIPYGDLQILNRHTQKEKTYGIIGNHDPDGILEAFSIRNLHGKIIETPLGQIVGLGGTFKYKNSLPLSFSQKESIAFARSLPKADILISHDAAFNPCKAGTAHQGLMGITEYIMDKKPKYHLHGHLHEPGAKIFHTGIFTRTKSICVYKSQLIELPLPTK